MKTIETNELQAVDGGILPVLAAIGLGAAIVGTAYVVFTLGRAHASCGGCR